MAGTKLNSVVVVSVSSLVVSVLACTKLNSAQHTCHVSCTRQARMKEKDNQEGAGHA